MPWQTKKPDLKNDPRYLEPKINDVAAHLAQNAEIISLGNYTNTLKNLLEQGVPVAFTQALTITETIEIPLDVPLYLDGRGKGKLIFQGTGACIKVNRSRRATLKDFEIEGTGQFDGQIGILFSSPNDSNLSEGSNTVEIGGIIGTKLDTHMILNTVYNSVIYKNRGRLIRNGIIIRGKCMENEFDGNVMLASYRALSLEKSTNTSYTANGFFPEGQYFSGANTFDLYNDDLETEKATASTIFIESGYDIRFTGNYIANLNVDYGSLVLIKLDETEYNQCFYISFADNGLHGRDIKVLDAKANALYPYVISFSDNQINFNTGKFVFTNANFVKVVGNELKVDHDKRIADILGSNNIDLTSNTIYYGNTSNPTNLADTCVNIDTSNDISVNDNDIIYAFKTVSNPVITETASQRVRNLNNKYKDKINYKEVALANGGFVYFWRQGDMVMGSIHTNTEVLVNDTEIIPYPSEFKPTNGMNWKAEFPMATGANNRIALTNTGIRFFGTSANYMRATFFYVSQ
ncbi:hypothetical protein FZC79_10505 [Rossellomorea vietnamensis]|uniref:Uncharacterized protein n=1 Tax=Rossellomorea vietnamensis TaxID=218284 RepID=A0A5D4KFE0_9BACI|nr:hypothetical protein [Rossellomorea vietnamensis]TYR75589.1 hypothetical protein FZC79_10505 [Rossellomorea vietnamensis]